MANSGWVLFWKGYFLWPILDMIECRVPWFFVEWFYMIANFLNFNMFSVSVIYILFNCYVCLYYSKRLSLIVVISIAIFTDILMLCLQRWCFLLFFATSLQSWVTLFFSISKTFEITLCLILLPKFVYLVPCF